MKKFQKKTIALVLAAGRCCLFSLNALEKPLHYRSFDFMVLPNVYRLPSPSENHDLFANTFVQSIRLRCFQMFIRFGFFSKVV
jgi:hypothetical protein